MTDSVRRFIASPLFHIRPRRNETVALDLVTGNRFSSLSLKAARLLVLASDFCTLESAISNGFSDDDLDQAFKAGLVVWEDDPQFSSMRLWEDHHWSRSAYLVMSQFDLEYIEEQWPAEFEKIVEGRRKMMENYKREEEYPQRLSGKMSKLIDLSKPEKGPVRTLSQMFSRRSVRAFAGDPMHFNAFSAILYNSTTLVRMADQSRATGDPFFLLNSFYSWLELYIVVQNVTDLPRGIYKYEFERHSLHEVVHGILDEKIASVVQGQSWIGGSGFCVFVVVDWHRYMWLYRHSRAYINLLIQLGEFSQEMIQCACVEGMGGWMTPAVNEEAAGLLLGIDTQRCDAMFFLKIGTPLRTAHGEPSNSRNIS